MKVQLTEYYQDAKIILQPGQVADVDPVLGEWLVKHRKAVALTVEAKPAVLENVVLTDEQEQPAEEVPVTNTTSALKRSRSRK